MRKITYFGTSGKDRKIGIIDKGAVLCYHPNFVNGVRRIPRWMVWFEMPLRRKKVK